MRGGMDTFLEAYNLLRLYQGEIDNHNRLITSSKIEFVIKVLLGNKKPGTSCNNMDELGGHEISQTKEDKYYMTSLISES